MCVSAMALIPFLFFISFLSFCGAQVPFILWSSDGSTVADLREPTAGEILSGGKLGSYLKQALPSSPLTVLLFLQDELSTEDFTANGGVYGNNEDNVFVNLKSEFQSATPLVLPAVEWTAAASVQDILQQQLGVTALDVRPSDVHQLQLNPSQNSLLLIRLPYSDRDQEKEILKKNDETIGSVLSVLRNHNVPYTAVYTGLKPSHMIQDPPLMGDFTGRSLLQTPPPPAIKPPVTFNGTTGPCILLWANALNISYKNAPFFDLAAFTFNESVSLNGSICNGTLSRLVLNYQNVQGLQSLRLVFVMRNSFFPVSARNWTVMEQVELNYNGQTAIFNASRGIYSPVEYSFHCQMVSSIRSPLLVPRNQLANDWRLHFTDFQIQGFNVTGNFSYASDCASFFTPGIWMGLLISLLLVLILTYGLHMIMQVRTMDRFDDPKGPAISVPQNE